MAINDGFYWYKNVLKKQLKLASRIYLSIAIVLAPIFLMSSANAAVGGWDLKNPLAQGASTVYDATKNVVINGGNFIKESWVKITPTATSVAKVLARGGAGYALSVAVEQLLGSVDWVLDPANNRIIYYEYGEGSFKATVDGYIGYGSSKTAACESIRTKIRGYFTLTSVNSARTEQSNYCFYNATTGDVLQYGTVVGEKGEKEEKYLPLPVVAQKVISNAEAGDTNAQVATTAAAADIVAEAEKDDVKARPIASQAEANATTKPADADAAAGANSGAATATPQADPVTGEQAPPTDIVLKFPIFCNWAPTICEAAQTVISFPQTLTNWWETGKSKAEEWALSISESWAAAKEWATSEPQEKEPENLDIEDLNIDADQVNLSGSSTCPQDSVSFSVMGKSVTLDMPYQPVCDALNFFKPAVLLVGAVASVYIVAGVRTKEEDEV